MLASNIRLPQIELPTDEILDDEDSKVSEAFEVILDAFKRGQRRIRSIKKAYNELESITSDLLHKFEVPETASNHEASKPLVDRKRTTVNSSTPKSQDGRVKSTDKHKQSEDEVCRKTFKTLDLEARPSTSGISRIPKKQDSWIEDESGNEENTPPLVEKSLNPDDSSCYPEEARAVKISLAKTIYTMESRKTPKHKSLKQATLVFQPIATKTDLTLSQKKLTKKPDAAHKSGNLFDEDYRTKKKTCDRIEGRSEPTELIDLLGQDKRSTSTPNVVKAKVGLGKKKIETTTPRKTDSIIVIPTASQIDETARSLFDDEDHDNFSVSPDILESCTDFPAVHNSSVTDVKKDFREIEKNRPPAGTSKVSQCVPLIDSIDETFFAPAEMDVLKNAAKEKPALAGCSKITEPRETFKEVRPLKRKSNDESIIDTSDDFEDLALQDINWDAEISNDNWTPSENPNDSYHIPPQKIKKSPQYAHKGNVERNMAKRSKLRGWDCAQCEKYYANMDLSESEMKKRINECSRHRSKYNPRYCTPAGFWNPEFPEAPDSSDYSDG